VYAFSVVLKNFSNYAKLKRNKSPMVFVLKIAFNAIASPIGLFRHTSKSFNGAGIWARTRIVMYPTVWVPF